MAENRNPQAEQMAHESMVRNLAAQAEAVWPQERELLARHAWPRAPEVLDLGCGTGEFAFRFAAWRPEARVLGVDIHEPHLERARARCPGFGSRVRFQTGNAFALDLPADAFDFVACRHMLQAVPDPEQVLAGMLCVTRPGGRLHVLAEDYGMMHFHPTPLDADEFWRLGPMTFAARTGTDLRFGRKAFTLLRKAGLARVRVDYIVVDTQRVPRELFAAVWEAWRDGYSAAIARESRLEAAEVQAHFAGMLAAIRHPDGYAVWQLPVVSGVKPA